MDGSAADDLKSLKILVKELSTKLADSRDEENKIDELIAAVAADAGINYEDFKRHQLAKSKEYFTKWDREAFNGGIRKASNNSHNNNNNNNSSITLNNFNTFNRNNNDNGMVMSPSAASLASASPSTSAELSAPVTALSAEIFKLSAMTDRTMTAESDNNNNNNTKSPSARAIAMASIPPYSANSSNGLNSPTSVHEEDDDLDDLDKEIIKYQTENIKLEQQIQRNEFLITKYLPLLDREEEILKGLHDFLKEKDFAREKGEKILLQRFELQKSISDERINDLKQRHNATEKTFVQLYSMWCMIYHIVNKDLAKAESIKMEVEMVEDDVRLLLDNFNGYLNLADGDDKEEEEEEEEKGEADIYSEKNTLEEKVAKGGLKKYTNEDALKLEENTKVNKNENGNENGNENESENKSENDIYDKASIEAKKDSTDKGKLENKHPKDSQTASIISKTSISSDGTNYDDIATQKTTPAQTTPTKINPTPASEAPSISSPILTKTVSIKATKNTKSQENSDNSNYNGKEHSHITFPDAKTNDEIDDEDHDKDPTRTSNARAALVDIDSASPPKTPPMAIK